MRLRAIALFASLSVCHPGYAVAPSHRAMAADAAAPLPTDPVLREIAIAHLNYAKKKSDPFALYSASSNILGQKFSVVTQPVFQNIQTSLISGPYFIYENGELIINYHRTAKISVYGSDAGLWLYSFSRKLISIDKVDAQNDYGAQVVVSIRKSTIDAISSRSAPRGYAAPDEPNNDKTLYKDNYTYRTRLPGAAAKELVADIDLVIRGKIVMDEHGNVADCETEVVPAFLQRPIETHDETCWVSADIEQIFYRRRSTGEVLASWPPTN